MAALLVSLAVMAILMTAALPTWRQAAQREREEELIFRGKQYARAVELFQRRYANAFPPNVDVLIEQRFLRKKYLDPMVEGGEFQLLYQMDAPQLAARQGAGRGGIAPSKPSGAARGGGVQGGLEAPVVGGRMFEGTGARGGVIGVVSTSTDKSIRLYNGRNYYNEWQFAYIPLTIGPGGGLGGIQRPGQGPGGGRGAGGMGGMGPGRGAGGRGGAGGGRGMGPAGPERGRGGVGPPPTGRMGPGRGSFPPDS
jgi:type II secretory pathway pseudopilin PulG